MLEPQRGLRLDLRRAQGLLSDLGQRGHNPGARQHPVGGGVLCQEHVERSHSHVLGGVVAALQHSRHSPQILVMLQAECTL